MNLKRPASDELLPTRVRKVRITDSQAGMSTWLGDSFVSVAKFLGHNLSAFIEGCLRALASILY